MKKGYYWIPRTDFTWNAMQFYKSWIIGDIGFDMKCGEIHFRLSYYFPVGSIFHFTGNKKKYVIKERKRTYGLQYIAKRMDGCPLTKEDIDLFTSGHSVVRDGYENGV